MTEERLDNLEKKLEIINDYMHELEILIIKQAENVTEMMKFLVENHSQSEI